MDINLQNGFILGAALQGKTEDSNPYSINVTFMNDENEWAKVGVTENGKIAEPIMPTVPSGKMFKGWLDGSTIVEFPYIPQGDKTLYANIVSDLSGELYEFYDLDKQMYPYVLVRRRSAYGGSVSVYFPNSYEVDGTSLTVRQGMYGYKNISTFVTDPTDLPSVIEYVKTNVPRLTTLTDGIGTGSAGEYIYTNIPISELSALEAFVYEI